MSDMSVFWQIILIALAVSAISTTIAFSSLFHPIRRRAKAHLGWFGKLISCGYCNSHWLALFAVAWFHPRVFDGWWLANFVVVVFAVIAVANVVTGIVRKTNYFWGDPENIAKDAVRAAAAAKQEGHTL